jgi:hypothetical protein
MVLATFIQISDLHVGIITDPASMPARIALNQTTRGRSSTIEQTLPQLRMWVRFPSPAP